MLPEPAIDPLPQWTAGPACRARFMHCDWCPYVLSRPAESITDAGSIFPIEDVHCIEDGSLLVRGIENDWTPPPQRRCPFGRTFAGSREARTELVIGRVARSEITAEQAEAYLVALGVDIGEAEAATL